MSDHEEISTKVVGLSEIFSIGLVYLANVKEHATLSAGASVDHRMEVVITGYHRNRAAGSGCCVSACSAISSTV